MTTSILNDIKKALGQSPDDDSFDVDILMHINSVFARLTQLGVGPLQGFMIEDDEVTWDAILNNDFRLNNVKSYIYLRVRMLFDPPSNSFTQSAMEKQIEQMEWLICEHQDGLNWVHPNPVAPEIGSIIDGGYA